MASHRLILSGLPSCRQTGRFSRKSRRSSLSISENPGGIFGWLILWTGRRNFCAERGIYRQHCADGSQFADSWRRLRSCGQQNVLCRQRTGAHRADGEIVSPIRATQPINGITRVVVSRSHRSQDESLERFTGGAENCEFIAMGSSLKFCLIAEGSADIYSRIGPTMEWDTAAAHCILEEAGGFVTDFDGNSLHYNKPVLVNPGFLARGSCHKPVAPFRA